MEYATYRRLQSARTALQLFVLLFLIAVPVLNWLGIHWIIGTLYSISIGDLDIADPAMALQTTLLTRELYGPLLLAAAIPAVLALVFGRVFCSWMCPYNTLAEWADNARRFLFRKRWTAARVRVVPANPKPFIYWGIFTVLLVAVLVAGLPLLSYLSAPGILSSQLSQGILGFGVGPELALVALLLVAEIALARRFWCKYACPVGAGLSLFRGRRTMRITRDAERCGCKPGGEACRIACPLGLAPKEGDVYPYCFNCGSCLKACEKTRRSALQFSFGRGSDPDRGGAAVPAGRDRLVGIEPRGAGSPVPTHTALAGEALKS
jgi:ferredoxin-type protein NapH